jgi:hypothetical protein
MPDLTRSEQMLVAAALRLGRDLPQRPPEFLLLALRPSLSDADCGRLAGLIAAREERLRILMERARAHNARVAEARDGRRHLDDSKIPTSPRRRVIRKGEPFS